MKKLRRFATVSTMADEKKELRKQVRAELKKLTAEELVQSDKALFERFLALPQVQKAKTIFGFWGIKGKEPETPLLIKELIAQGKTICLPRMLPGHLMELPMYEPDRPMIDAGFGIWEPNQDAPLIPKDQVDLVLVPAVAYDKQGYRLGFGGGYYDRWLENYKGDTVGLCRDAVLQDKVPTEPHDSKVDVLLTESRCIDLR